MFVPKKKNTKQNAKRPKNRKQSETRYEFVDECV